MQHKNNIWRRIPYLAGLSDSPREFLDTDVMMGVYACSQTCIKAINSLCWILGSDKFHHGQRPLMRALNPLQIRPC